MSLLESIAVVLAGLAAGTINTVVGSGTLITFPTLLAFGVPPVTANVSNTVGLVPGSVAGAFGYRSELEGQRGRVLRLLSASVLGGIVGALLLLVLSPGAFEAIVPVLILLGVVLVIVQPRLAARVQARAAARATETGVEKEGDHGWVWPAVFGTGVYGGYFGAAQGVLLMGVLGIGVDQSLQRSNAVKNILAGAVNGVAGVIFIVIADVDWQIVALVGGGAVVGGLLGARIGKRLPPLALRTVIVVVGLVAIASMLLG
ncbi:sulfite exporter TauE/SafE family protein [Nocardioides sp. GXZ039]|uniref:sulfite exporter TauE/SafE family protein n=1 Tax=Nocardioides sp. GXZ039 TaxID=3136018 RepID=UPI0030F47AA7